MGFERRIARLCQPKVFSLGAMRGWDHSILCSCVHGIRCIHASTASHHFSECPQGFKLLLRKLWE